MELSQDVDWINLAQDQVQWQTGEKKKDLNTKKQQTLGNILYGKWPNTNQVVNKVHYIQWSSNITPNH